MVLQFLFDDALLRRARYNENLELFYDSAPSQDIRHMTEANDNLIE